MMKRLTSRTTAVGMIAALTLIVSAASASAQSRSPMGHWQDQAYQRVDGSFFASGGHFSNWPHWGVGHYPQWGAGSYEMPGSTISGLNGI